MATRPSGRPRVLLVEDDRPLAEPIRRGLEEEGYSVALAEDGEAGLTEALAGSYDVLIVDWRLPRLDGRALIRRVRAAGLGVPVVMLTALRDVDHRVAGLDAGADDYLTKPFSFEELLARLRALRRRASEQPANPADLQETHLQAGALVLDTARRQVRLGDVPLDLRAKEYQLLELLMHRRGEAVSRSVIAERVWGSILHVTDNAIDVTVSGLRRALGEAAETAREPPGVSIGTVRGVGYRLVSASEDPA